MLDFKKGDMVVFFCDDSSYNLYGELIDLFYIDSKKDKAILEIQAIDSDEYFSMLIDSEELPYLRKINKIDKFLFF